MEVFAKLLIFFVGFLVGGAVIHIWVLVRLYDKYFSGALVDTKWTDGHHEYLLKLDNRYLDKIHHRQYCLLQIVHADTRE